jgi:surfactin synthase thioesterase subunit
MSKKALTALNNPVEPISIVIFLHWVGGMANSYRRMANKLKSAKAYAISLPGRSFTQEPINSLYQLHNAVDFVQDIILSSNLSTLNLPIILFGHSYGGIIAYEVAKKVSSINKLILSAVPNPAGLISKNLSLQAASNASYQLNDDELISYIRRIGGIFHNMFFNT